MLFAVLWLTLWAEKEDQRGQGAFHIPPILSTGLVAHYYTRRIWSDGFDLAAFGWRIVGGNVGQTRMVLRRSSFADSFYRRGVIDIRDLVGRHRSLFATRIQNWQVCCRCASPVGLSACWSLPNTGPRHFPGSRSLLIALGNICSFGRLPRYVCCRWQFWPGRRLT